jgi:hypothetical protein
VNTGAAWALVAAGWLVTVPVGWRSRQRTLQQTCGERGVARWVPLAWLLPAAGWLLVASTGRPLAGFSHHTAVLTAAHFVHAGFGVSMLMWLGGHRRALWVHQVGMCAVAAGIAEWPVLQPVGAACIVVALASWSIGNVRRLRLRLVAGWRAVILAVASAAWCPPMVLALSWASAQVGIDILARTLDQMIVQHGMTNALVVVLPGLVALTPTGVNPSPTPRNTEMESPDDHAPATI